MRFATLGRPVLFAIAGAATALVTTSALAGGNGNGGSGSGGAHGAATSGMTYHSEPVNSPWNRPVGTVMDNSGRPVPEATASTSPDTGRMQKKSTQ